MSENFDLSKLLQKTPDLNLRQKIDYVWKLSVPGIMAQVSSILMQYIDAAMVGRLGAEASAAIGLVASSTWVTGSIISASCIGFTVQVAHCVGEGNQKKAKDILTQSVTLCLILDAILMVIACFLSPFLPHWLGGDEAIIHDAYRYFLIYALSIPFYHMVYLMSGMLQCSGNMKSPSILNALMCLLDVLFNLLFIFGLKLGVTGAALGSASAALVTAAIILLYTFKKSGYLSLRNHRWIFLQKAVLIKAVKLSVPVAVESTAFTGALVVVTRIIAPLGAVSLAANSFAVTAESLCYMPGYGIQEASTTLVGQSTGAKRPDLSRSFAWITILMGMLVMAFMGFVMYLICPFVLKLLTPVAEIQDLGVKILRIELFAEPLYGAAIVCSGALRGDGDTLVPSIMNLISIWIVRLGLSILLVKPYGLVGIWIAMTAELCFRGIIFLSRVSLHLGKNKKAKA